MRVTTIKSVLPRVKQWLDFKAVKHKQGQSLCDYVKDYYKANHDNYKFFALVMAGALGLLLFLGWLLGITLIAWLEDVPWAGGVARVLLVGVFGWIYFVIMRKIFRYMPIRRDRLMFSRTGWGMALYSFIAVVIILCYIVTIGLVMLQASDVDTAYNDDPQQVGLLWSIVSQFADPGSLPHAQRWGKVVSLLSAVSGILCLSGFVITSLVSMITRRTQYWQRGLIRYERDFKDYVVVIGLNEQTATIVKKSLKRDDVDYVLVQTSRSVEQQRARLELKLERDDEQRVVFYYGDRTVYEDIADLRLENAREVYILGEDMDSESEQDHDSYNMKCLELISQYCQELSQAGRDVGNRWWGTKLKCHVELEYQSTYTIFKSTHIYKRLNQSVEFVPFNVYEIWAKKVLVDNYAILPGKKQDEHIVQRYQPIDSYRDSATRQVMGITKDSDQSVHLIVVGMNQMGIAMAMQTALLVHLPNYPTRGIRTTITFIDENAAQEGEYLMGHYEALFSLCRHRTIKAQPQSPIKMWSEENAADVDPMLAPDARYSHLDENFMDIQWEFIEGSLASTTVRDYLKKVTKDPLNVCTIAVCMNDPQQSIAAALYLPEMVLKRVQQVLVYQRNNFDLIDKVATSEKQWKRYEKLKPFGMIADCYKGDMFDAIMPKLVLALYKSNTDIKQRTIGRVKDKDLDAFIERINLLWSEVGIVDRLSNINAAESFKSKLRSAGLTEFSSSTELNKVLSDTSKMDTLIAAEHQRWVTERLTMGFRPLDAQEMAYFQKLTQANPDKPLPIEGKAKKEYLKSKSRAHLDICSTAMLEHVDPKVSDNDMIILKNLIRGTFLKTESRIIARLALKREAADVEKGESLDTAAMFLRNMTVVPSGKLSDSHHKVLIPGMWVGSIPVTQLMWKTIMGSENNPSIDKGENTDHHPVNGVSKEDIEDFILMLNDITGLHFSLPTRDEWLYCALGGLPIKDFNVAGTVSDGRACLNTTVGPNVPGVRTRPLPFVSGDEVGGEGKNETGNGYGLSDMLGNVWEWTRTNHGASTFIFCGGSWRYGEKECDLADENEPWCRYWTPEYKSDDLGFRLVLYHEFKMNKTSAQKPMVELDKMISNIASHMEVIPSGDFMMGTDEVAVCDGTPAQVQVDTLPDERPAHEVHVSEFMMSNIPVTQRQYQAIMEVNPSEQKGQELPVDHVSYLDARAFVDKLNGYCTELLARQGVEVTVPIFALPTQAQWEYAARGGSVPYDSYTVYSGSDNPDVVAWHFGITKGTHEVGKKTPNCLNLYDMCGNVWEWCSDWYQSDYYKQCTGLQINPKGPAQGITHVLRGGSWRFTAGECRLTRLSHWPEDYKAADVGFRLVANVPKSMIDQLREGISSQAQEAPDTTD